MSRRSQGLVDYEQVSGLYEEGRALPPDILAKWQEVVRPYLPDGARRVIDLGAGTGIFARVWPAWTQGSVVALEPAAAMIRTGSRASPEVPYVRAVAEAIPLGAGTVDVVWISTALHHFVDIGRAVSEMRRVLAPGGRVLVRTFVPGRTEIAWTNVFPQGRWQDRTHTEAQLTDLFTEQGFTFVDACEVLELTQTYEDSARWVTRMRHADSLLTALTDDEVAAGLEALRSQPTKLGRMELSLFVFELSL